MSDTAPIIDPDDPNLALMPDGRLADVTYVVPSVFRGPGGAAWVAGRFGRLIIEPRPS
jgi:hypothetical protein